MPQRALRSDWLDKPAFWANHLRWAMCGPISRLDHEEADASYGMSLKEIDDFYFREVSNEQEWPYFEIALQGGGTIEVEYSNEPEDYEVHYRIHEDRSAAPILLGKSSGHWMLPAFRWSELEAISKAVDAQRKDHATSDQAILLLYPATWLTEDDDIPAVRRRLIEACDGLRLAPGGRSSSLVDLLVASSRGDVQWRKHDQYGWVNNESNSYRNPDESGALSINEFDTLRRVFGKLGHDRRLGS